MIKGYQIGVSLYDTLVPGVVHGGDGDPPQQLQASLAGFERIHRGAEQKPDKGCDINRFTTRRSKNLAISFDTFKYGAKLLFGCFLIWVK